MVQKMIDHGKLIARAWESLGDEESREIFRVKIDWILNHDDAIFLDWFLENHKELYCPELEEYEKSIWEPGEECPGYILFGAGVEGIKARKILEACNRKVLAFCDNQSTLWGTVVEGVEVISPARLLHEFKGARVIITPRNCQLDIYRQLLLIGCERKLLMIPMNGFLLGFSGTQYFDFLKPQENEVFVDGGCWNGDTSLEFVRWCQGNYSKIHAFEPDQICWETCLHTFEQNKIRDVVFHKTGTWNKTESLYFQSRGQGGSKVCSRDEANMEIKVTAIDDVLKGERVSLIKLDVEGSEYEALLGAKESIRKHKPRLAVCAYHKPDDMWKLIDLILELNNDYRIYLRHYTTCDYETVIYAC